MNAHKKNRIMTDTFTDPITVSDQENAFLQQQADEAKAAIGCALSEAKAALVQGMDPSAWTRKYPLVAVGSALAAGFVAAMVTVKSNEPQPVSPQPPYAPPPPPKPGFWSSLIHEAVEMIRPVLTTALIAAFKSPPSSQEPPNHPPTG